MDSHHESEAQPARSPYEKPALARWGDLRALTQGGTGDTKKDTQSAGTPKTKFGA